MAAGDSREGTVALPLRPRLAVRRRHRHTVETEPSRLRLRRKGAADRHPTLTSAQQPRHQLRLPARQRQRRDHRDRGEPKSTDSGLSMDLCSDLVELDRGAPAVAVGTGGSIACRTSSPCRSSPSGARPVRARRLRRWPLVHPSVLLSSSSADPSPQSGAWASSSGGLPATRWSRSGCVLPCREPPAGSAHQVEGPRQARPTTGGGIVTTTSRRPR
jgi:hypothetical protein